MTGIYSEHDRAATDDDGDPHNDDDRDCKNAVGDDGVDEGDVGDEDSRGIRIDGCGTTAKNTTRRSTPKPKINPKPSTDMLPHRGPVVLRVGAEGLMPDSPFFERYLDKFRPRCFLSTYQIHVVAGAEKPTLGL